jgi:serine/threonine protein phosphatase PrpC
LKEEQMNKRVTAATRQGKQTFQEDFYVHLHLANENGLEGELLAVMDGHGESAAAKLCADEIPKLYRIENAADAENSLRQLVRELDAKTRHMSSGTTVSLALVLYKPSQVSVAILGDSPVVVLDNRGELHHSPDHNVIWNPDERAAARKRGATIREGYIFAPGCEDGLAMLILTRSCSASRMFTPSPSRPGCWSAPTGCSIPVID